jgi:hypothetical protein
MWIIPIENLINQAKKQYEKELATFKDQPFIHCKLTFYFTLYYTIENYLMDIIPVNATIYQYKNGYLKYWRGKIVFRYRNKQAILTDDIHDIMDKLGLNKLAKKIEKETREKTGTQLEYD